MANKSYTLVAWTENGEVRMIPSLINELSLPYRERIEAIEGRYMEVENEVGWLLSQSRAHEDLARFFLRVGRPIEAYEEFSNAAMVCAYCSDSLWLQGVHGDYPTLPLLYRFLAMHRRCKELIKKRPILQYRYEGSDLQRWHFVFTLDDRETDAEFDEAYEIRKAWRFGKTA